MKPRLSLFLGRAAALAVATSFVTTTIATPVLAAEPALADTARQIVIVGLAADEKENAEFLGEVQRAVEEHVNAEGKWRGTGEIVNLPARTMLVAACTSPNIMYEKEHRGTFRLDESDLIAVKAFADGVSE